MKISRNWTEKLALACLKTASNIHYFLTLRLILVSANQTRFQNGATQISFPSIERDNSLFFALIVTASRHNTWLYSSQLSHQRFSHRLPLSLRVTWKPFDSQTSPFQFVAVKKSTPSSSTLAPCSFREFFLVWADKKYCEAYCTKSSGLSRRTTNTNPSSNSTRPGGIFLFDGSEDTGTDIWLDLSGRIKRPW